MSKGNLERLLTLENVTMIQEEGGGDSASDFSSDDDDERCNAHCSRYKSQCNGSNGLSRLTRSRATLAPMAPSSLGAPGRNSLKSNQRALAPMPSEKPSVAIAEEIERSLSTHSCDLSDLHLREVPRGLPMTALTRLSLSLNELETLPENIFSFPNAAALEEIDVNSNHLTSLPLSLFALPKLRVLQMNHNRLTSLPGAVTGQTLPKHFVFLPALERVGMDFNDLREFPACFFLYCERLEEVLLAQNEHMQTKEMPVKLLERSPAGKAWLLGQRQKRVSLRVDNSPKFVEQMQRQNWDETLPWLELNLHKIYPDKVLDFLYLGSMRTAQSVNIYHELNIHYVLTIGRNLTVSIEPGMHHKVVLLDDFPGADLSVAFTESFQFIDAARAAQQGILIHCFAGLSRSVAIAAAYIMKTQCMTLEQAMTVIKAARPAANPNEGFLATLKLNEKALMSGKY